MASQTAALLGPRTTCLLLGLNLLLGCSEGGSGDDGAGTALGGDATTAGAAPLGSARDTGGVSDAGGTATGGAGNTGGTAAGGAEDTGGAEDSGGTATGGAEDTGGMATGGAEDTGGASTGGAATGGVATGGAEDTGGTTTGGSGDTGGTATGGAATGGEATGGASTGGAATGGETTGGASTGGAGTGGEATGGAEAGGSPSSGGASSGCPLELVGFASLDGGTTGGGDAAATTVTTQDELRSCATADEPRVCRVVGTLEFDPFEEIRVTSRKTIIGAGADAEIVMGGFFVGEGIHDVVIRNLTIRDSYVEGQYDEGGDDGGDRDGIQLDTAHHVWIDHCRFVHLGDGMIDSRKDTTFETVSWNVFEDHNKTFGIGWTENVTAELTIHHNVIRDTVQRNPSTDNVLRAHLYNNVLERVSSYGNYARGATNMVLEQSLFIAVNDAHYFDTGTLVAIGNEYRDCSGQREASGSSYSFFDPHDYYAYTLDPVAELEALLARCAGPLEELGQ